MADLTQEEILEMLPEKVKKYYEYDAQEKSIKDQKEPIKDEIKKLMRTADLDKFEVEDLEASYKIQERTKMNEIKLLNRLKELGLTEAIEVVERPNIDKVETLLYDNKLDPALISDCLEIKEIEVLSVKKKKRKKVQK